ncbi:hypothetical protein TNIN_449281 [Trichonephila inaurata madagascariensis]|uniref:Uncharacterized protein n=1 Tax=Trichonephila inaurata madagascariensis TaxID=2747483 RepID=A0A8X7CFE9_9ARAC|nr:hypothetical protein TNIN_449281 [Trichonephila inaurata madagascariensis]
MVTETEHTYLALESSLIKKEDLPSRGLPLHLGGLTFATSTNCVGTPCLNACDRIKKAYLLSTGAILDQEEGSPEQRPAIALGWADSRHFHKAWLSGVRNFW